MRGRRSNNEAPLSLFAFQDIIMATAGVMLFILILLVVQLSATEEVSSKESPQKTQELPPAPTAAEMAELRAEIDRTQAILDVLDGRSAARVRADLDLSKSEIRDLTDKLAERSQYKRQIQGTLRTGDAAKELQWLSRETARQRQHLERLDAQLATMGKRRHLYLREADDTSAKTVVIDCHRTHAISFPMGSPTTATRIDANVQSIGDAVLRWISRQETSNRKFLILLRPSAAGIDQELGRRLHKMGLRFTIDLLSRDASLSAIPDTK